MKAIQYFSSSYQEAREKFLQAVKFTGGKIESIKNPCNSPEGEALFTDIALIGSKYAENILVLNSGTHGIEGFVGSAIQTGLLHQGIAKCLKQNMSILLIHAINPFGFAHLRRVNEDNIDLNRNFIDHSKPHPTNLEYDELDDIIAPKYFSFWTETLSWSRLYWHMIRNGNTRLQKAISGGQYSHPKGLFYGGQFETWSNKMIRSITPNYLANASHAVIIDFHTGLGQYGNIEIILHVPEKTPAYERAVAIWGTPNVRSTASGKSLSVDIDGSLKSVYSKILPNVEITAVSLEYGTLPLIQVFRALRRENWLYHYGGREHPHSINIKTNLLRAFYPDSDNWRNLTWNQGKNIVEQTVLYMRSTLYKQ